MSKQKTSIQQKMKQLEVIVQWFESDEVDIDEALLKYEEGLVLVNELQSDVKVAKNKFTKLQKSFSKDQ